MSQTAGDLRVRRTRKLLRDALIELIAERGFDAITVGDIAERAMVRLAGSRLPGNGMQVSRATPDVGV